MPVDTSKPVKPQNDEIATESKINSAVSLYANALTVNPDTILMTRGGGNYDIYKEVLRDDQVASCYQQRSLALTSREIFVEPASEAPEDVAAAEFIKEQLKRINLDDITKKMHYAIHYGFSVAEAVWAIEDNKVVLDKIKVRPRKYFAFNHEQELFLRTSTHPLGEKMPDRKFWVLHCGSEDDHNPYGLGLAHALYWPTFFKRNGMKFWLIFLEKFAQPTAKGTLPAGQASDPKERDKALNVLDAIQADSAVVVPDNLVVDLIEAARSGTADYNALCDKMDASISKIILSQTMTTDNGSSQAQAKVHEGVKDEIIKADADLIFESFNETIVKWLVEFNFANANPPRVYRDFSEEEDLNTRADRDNKISTLGFEPTLDYITETYGPGWVKKAPAATKPPLSDDPIPASFTEITPLMQKRIQRRADQEELVQVAKVLASDFQDVYKDQIEQLFALAEESGDFDTFNEHLYRLMQEQPKREAVETIARATFFSRLKGAMFQQKDK